MKAGDLISALVPAFVAGLAVQQLLELIDPWIRIKDPTKKKAWLNRIALMFGLVAGWLPEMRVVSALLKRSAENPFDSGFAFIDWLIAALIISAGTEGFNSILKFLGYKKDEKKAEAVRQQAEAARSVERAAEERTLSFDESRAMGGSKAACQACVAEAIFQWSGRHVQGPKQTLRELWEPDHGTCDADATRRLVEILNELSCGQQLEPNRLKCADTVESVRQLVCGF